jgi:hypothetical protein
MLGITPSLNPWAADRQQARWADEPARGLARLLTARGWPLTIILAIQAALSLRLVWTATAFQDEALYLAVGHLELAHLQHHVPIPDFATYLSGAPVVYPPLGAIADSHGGLAAARLLSLVFMLVATALLHGVTRRVLSSRTAACFAAALFGWIGPAQFLGAFATYDALALTLLALATWLGVRAASTRLPARLMLITCGCVALVEADATKYSATLFDPVVVMVVALAVWQARGRVAGLTAGAVMTLLSGTLLAVAYRQAGPSYAQGIASTTLHRAAGTESVTAVLTLSAKATGVIAVLAILGAAAVTFGRHRNAPTTALAWTMAAAEFLAPAEQARIHTTVSAFKHVGYGAWFASSVAGYLLVLLPRLSLHARVRVSLLNGTLAVCTAMVILAGTIGASVADAQYRDWPNSSAMIATLSGMSRPGGYYLIEDSNVAAYYLRASIRWAEIDNTFYFGYVDMKTGKYVSNQPAYAAAIRNRYFTTIVLAFGDTQTVDQVILQDISRYRTYRLVRIIPYQTSSGRGEYRIFTLAPAAKAPAHGRRKRAAFRAARRALPTWPTSRTA